MDPNTYPVLVAVLLFVIAVLIACLVVGRHVDVDQWQDAYLDEANRHQQTRDALTALGDSHRELQANFLTQGRELATAEAKLRAAERELS